MTIYRTAPAAAPQPSATGTPDLPAGNVRTPPGRRRRFRGGQRGQAVVEFGLIVILFALLISGMFDFGLLLNLRIGVSSLSRELARSASVGASFSELENEANLSPLLGVSTDPAIFSAYCCGPNDAVSLVVTYTHCDPGGCVSFSCPPSSSCDPPPLALPSPYGPGDRVEVEVTANGADVLTPLARAAFVCTNGAPKHCFQPLNAQTTMRFEGP